MSLIITQCLKLTYIAYAGGFLTKLIGYSKRHSFTAPGSMCAGDELYRLVFIGLHSERIPSPLEWRLAKCVQLSVVLLSSPMT
jgi:hypothetical protein